MHLLAATPGTLLDASLKATAVDTVGDTANGAPGDAALNAAFAGARG